MASRWIVINLLMSILLAVASGEDVFVTTNNGEVKGEKIHYTYGPTPSIDTYMDVFKGIPFAQPPLGDLRFKKPEPVGDWTSTWDATFYRPRCWQQQNENDTAPQDEDCLYLNVWSPDVTRSGIPVMVWIHGGAFLFGAASDGSYDGRVLVGFHDIVFVSINYRLNAFGFLATGDPELRGNYGLWDQNAGLKWIKENIAAFGGDPNQITIFGQSAGGASVGHQLIGKPSWDYFDRAMPISGNMMSPWGLEYNIDKARDDAFLLGRIAGCNSVTTSADLADCLRQVEARDLAAAANALTLTTTNIIPLVPVIDGEFITKHPRTLLAEGSFKQCDIFIGNTKDDGSLIVLRAYPEQIPRLIPKSDYDTFVDRIERFTYIDKTGITVDAIEQQYIDWELFDDPETNYFYNFMDIETDEAFHCTSEHTARTYALSGNRVYRYYFNHMPSNPIVPPLPTWWGVAHAEDIPFFFGWAFSDTPFSWDMTDDEKTLSLDMMRYYTNFAKTGDPNEGGDNDGEEGGESHWPEYKVPGLMTKEFSPTLDDLKGLRSDYCQLWNSFLVDLGDYTDSLSDAELAWREEFSQWKNGDLPEWRSSFNDYVENPDSCNP